MKSRAHFHSRSRRPRGVAKHRSLQWIPPCLLSGSQPKPRWSIWSRVSWPVSSALMGYRKKRCAGDARNSRAPIFRRARSSRYSPAPAIQAGAIGLAREQRKISSSTDSRLIECEGFSVPGDVGCVRSIEPREVAQPASPCTIPLNSRRIFSPTRSTRPSQKTFIKTTFPAPPRAVFWRHYRGLPRRVSAGRLACSR
jgi:hypothetical protein